MPLGKNMGGPGEWQPIQTAPKDASEILLFQHTYSGPFYRVGYWETDGINVHNDKREEGWSLADEGYTGCIEPTHWQPLPPPPTPNEEV